MDSIQIVLLGFCAFANVHAHVACNPGASAIVTAVALALANVALQLLWLLFPAPFSFVLCCMVVLLFFLCIFGSLLVCIVRVVYIASFFFLEQEQPVYERCGIFRLQEPAHFSCGKSVATKTAVALECACHLLLHFRACYPLYISTKRVCDLLFSGPPLVSCSVAEAL